jgi:Mg-chelatase subunit ChlD
MTLILAIPFIHPWIAASAAGLAAIPIVIHLLNRRRYRELDWAAMEFLLAASRRSARRVQIEQMLLLATRLLIMMVAALAVARPFVSAAGLSNVGAVRTHRLLLLDNSGSMQATDPSGQTNFDRAKTLAQRLLNSFPGGDGVSLVLLAKPASPVIGLNYRDRPAVAAALASVEPSQGSTDLIGAFAAAAQILKSSDAAPGNRVVYLIGDNTATGWGATGSSRSPAAAAAAEIAREARLVIVQCGDGSAENVAITALQPAANLIRPDVPCQWSAVMRNFGRTRQSGLSVELIYDGRLVRTEPVEPLSGGGRAHVQFQLHISEPGPGAVQLRLRQPQRDALDVDDARWFAVDVAEHVPVLLVDGRPGPTRFAGETGYLTTAMAPRLNATEQSWLIPKTVTDSELAAEALDDYRLIVLCNVRMLQPALWQRLSEYVSGGGAIWFFLGDQVNAEHYNQFGFAEGKGILPARLTAPDGQDEAGDTFFRLQPETPPHPVMADLADQATGGLFLARTRRYWRTDVQAGRQPVDVLLRYDSGSPAFLGRHVGRGYVLLCTTSANMAWTNLPAKGDFVSLVMELVGYSVPSRMESNNVLVGEGLYLPITAAQSSVPIRLTMPDGSSVPVGLRRDGDRFLTDVNLTTQCGLYQLRIADRRQLAAVNADEAESDLRVLSQTELADLLQCSFDYVRGDEDLTVASFTAPQRELSGTLFCLLLVLLLAETLMAMLFGHQG